MGKVGVKPFLGLRTKVIVPLLAGMLVFLLALTWWVEQRSADQMRSEAQRTLATVDQLFRERRAARLQEQLAHCREITRQSANRNSFGSQSADALLESLKELAQQTKADVVAYTPMAKVAEAVFQRKPGLELPASAFDSAITNATMRALTGNEAVDTVCAGDRLWDVFSIPVLAGKASEPGRAPVLGVVTLGFEFNREVIAALVAWFQSQVILIADGRALPSLAESKPSHEPARSGAFGDLFAELQSSNGTAKVRRIESGGEHYFCSAGRFASLDGAANAGYLLLDSCEASLRSQRHTLIMMVLMGLIAILSTAAMVWAVAGRTTARLDQLRAGVETMKNGDLSPTIQVHTHDECGELAEALRQMKHSVKQSREQLELTVETLKATQAQLIQSEKLSGIGEFVAGVAHELNNPLTSLMGFADLLAEADRDPKHKRYLEVIQASAQRCQKIVQSLLSFARRHKPERKAINLNEPIQSALEILTYQLRTSNIEIIKQLDPHLPQTMADPHQMQQVFVNVLLNARQAIEGHQPNGRIKIVTGVRSDQVRVTIEDNGPGILPEHLSRVFDPFFTTKEIGGGAGLGLSQSYGIIKEHGGSITPRSDPGAGATFIIELPIAQEANGESQKKPPETEVINPREGVGRRVLVIDDEESIQQMVKAALTCRGYRVDMVSDGEAGLRRMTQTRYDVTLCDCKMPGLSGQEVYERVKARDPELSDRIIFITGDVENQRTQRFLEENRRVCLPKPFTIAEFREAIAKMLAGG